MVDKFMILNPKIERTNIEDLEKKNIFINEPYIMSKNNNGLFGNFNFGGLFGQGQNGLFGGGLFGGAQASPNANPLPASPIQNNFVGQDPARYRRRRHRY
uniref:Uncharacterized protein n=1 Tax=Euplotes harpa TaxID=151035 RepID=A0A7S3N679_9SPIT